METCAIGAVVDFLKENSDSYVEGLVLNSSPRQIENIIDNALPFFNGFYHIGVDVNLVRGVPKLNQRTGLTTTEYSVDIRISDYLIPHQSDDSLYSTSVRQFKILTSRVYQSIIDKKDFFTHDDCNFRRLLDRDVTKENLYIPESEISDDVYLYADCTIGFVIAC